MSSTELEKDYCPICVANATNYGLTPILDGVDAAVLLKCSSCGHQWLLKHEQFVDQVAQTMVQRQSTTLSADWVLSWMPKDLIAKKNLKLMDIGCWDGALLQQFPQSWTRDGVEFNRDAVSIAKSRGLNIVQGKFGDVSLPLEKYDLILMLDVLEHISNPMHVLSKISEALAPDGVFLVLTGNAASLSARIFGVRWYYLHYPEHISFFSPDSAKFALKKLGFKAIEIYKVSHHASGFLITMKKMLLRLLRIRSVGSAALPAAVRRWDNVLLNVSRILRGSDHMLIVCRKTDL